MRTLLKAFLVTSLIMFSLPAIAQVRFNISIGVPPPPVTEVVVASPGPGYVWIPGYHFYDERSARWQWVAGRWDNPPSPSHVWVAPRYVRRGSYYEYYQGRWKDNGKHKGWQKNKGHGNRG